jgi:hypothetical protein
MRASRIVVLAIGLCSAVAATAQVAKDPLAWAKEPDGFRGVKFNATKAEAASIVAFDSACSKVFGHEEEICSSTFQLGEIGAVKTGIGFVDDRLVYVSAPQISAVDYPSLKEIFVERYGIPTFSKRERLQTDSGATFQNETLLWEGKAVRMILIRFAGSIEHSEFIVALKSYADGVINEKKSSDKKAADKL